MDRRRRGQAGGVPGILRALPGSPGLGLYGHRPAAPRSSCAPSRLAGTAEGVGIEGVQMMHPSLWPHLDWD